MVGKKVHGLLDLMILVIITLAPTSDCCIMLEEMKCFIQNYILIMKQFEDNYNYLYDNESKTFWLHYHDKK